MGLKDTDLYREMTLPLATVCIYASIAGAGFGWDNLSVLRIIFAVMAAVLTPSIQVLEWFPRHASLSRGLWRLG